MTVFQPDSSLVAPIIHQLALIIQNQIAGVTLVYEDVPDGAPEDGSAVIPLSKFDVIDDTNGALYLKLTFGIRHMIRRSDFAENLATAYSYLPAYLQAFSSWENQSLNGLAESVNPTSGGVTQFIETGQAFVALLINVTVYTRYNIPI
jgi:hypothetical protein